MRATPLARLHWTLRVLLAAACLCGAARARASGWVQALSEYAKAPSDLGDPRRPLAERIRAANALGRFGPESDAVGALLAALEREKKQPLEPALRAAIFDALARRASPRASAPLVQRFEKEEAPSEPLANALAAIADGPALGALANALARPKAAAVAELALGRVGARAAPALANAVESVVALRATRVLAALGPAAAAPAHAALARALASESPELRTEAATALGRLEDRASAPALVARLIDPALAVVAAALAALARVAGPAEAPALLQFATDAPASLRAPALAALCAADPGAAIPLLERALSASDPALRAAAFARLEAERVDPRFLPLLANVYAREPRAASASALARIADGRGIEPLLRMAERTPDAAERAAPALALGLRRFEHALARGVLERGRALLRSLPTAELRLALSALSRDVSALPDALAALSAKDPKLRANGALALAWLDARAAVPQLFTALARETEREAARRMLEALRELSAQAGFDTQRARFDDDETAPEAIALVAPHPGAAQRGFALWLRRALDSTRAARVRCAAALALGALGDRAAHAPLAAALDDAAPRVRLCAVRALAALGGSESVRALSASARVERDERVRRAALESLRHAGVATPSVEDGPLALELQLRMYGGSARPLLDVLLDDGRWLRLRALPSNLVIVLDLPPGSAEVNVID